MPAEDLIARRAKSLTDLIRLRAPKPIIISAARHYLQTLEGSTRRAIVRWCLYELWFWSNTTWDTIRMRWCMHVRGMTRLQAAEVVFGPDFGDFDE